ncbi:MAG: hypothetical protein LUH82_08070 [Clostridiales bacterium]|nr:hypothetical protein [Clostridiales bacterium]
MAENAKKLSFQMNEKEYLAAVKFKNKALSGKRLSTAGFWAAVLFAAAAGLMIFNNMQAAAMAGAAFVLLCVFALIKRLSVKKAFSTSPTLNAGHLITFEKNLEITNNFEKITCPDFNIFAAGQTGEFLFLIATPRKGCFCINKNRYSSPELDSLIAALKSAGKFKEEK